MTRSLIINPLAEKDLAEAWDWYEAQRSGLGDEFLTSVRETLHGIGRMPESHARIIRDVRRVVVRRFAYGAFYRVDDDQITVVAVYHARRDPRGWEDRI